MGKKLDIGVGNIARKGKKAWIGVDNKARKIKKMWLGDASGKARLFFSSGKVLVATAGAYSYYSEDNGKTWIQGSTQFPNNTERTYSATNGDIVVATRKTGTNVPSIMYTKDGNVWTAVSGILGQNTNGVLPISYIPELNKFFIVRDGEDYNSIPTVDVYSSQNGVTWTIECNIKSTVQKQIPLTYDAKSNHLLLLCYHSAGTEGGYNMIKWIEPENLASGSWQHSTPASSNHLITAYGYSSNIASANGTSVTIAHTPNVSLPSYYSWYSVDGKTWTRGTISSQTWGTNYNIMYANGKFYALGQQYMMYTNDVRTWTFVEPSGFPTYVYPNKDTYIYDGERFLVHTSNAVYQSTDGITWATLTPFGGAGQGIVSYLL